MSDTLHAHDTHGQHGDHGHAHPPLGFIRKYLFSIDHKIIGIQFLFMGLTFFVIGGLLAMLIRQNLGWPDSPPPVLGMMLWSQLDPKQSLGNTSTVDPAGGTLTVRDIGWRQLQVGDNVSWKVTGQGVVKSVDKDKGAVVVTSDALGDPNAPAPIEKPALTPTDPAKPIGQLDTIDRAGKTITFKTTKGSPYPYNVGESIGWSFIRTGTAKDVDGDTAVITSSSLPAGEPLAAAGTSVLGKRVPGNMPGDFYTMVFTMHASIMIFFVIIPLLVGTFGNYLVPLKIGAGDMAFPFLNGLAFWSAVPTGAIMLAGFFMPGNAAAAGWTSYPPLSAVNQNTKWLSYVEPHTALDHVMSFMRVDGHILKSGVEQHVQGTWPTVSILVLYVMWYLMFAFIGTWFIRFQTKILNNILCVGLSMVFAYFATIGTQYAAFDGQSCWFFSIFLLGFSSLMGAVNYLTTMIKLRCPGMTMFRMPLSVWSLFITSVLVLLATPVLAATLLLNLLEHHVVNIGGETMRFASFFTPYNWIDQSVGVGRGVNAGGGYPILHQHLFWFYSHPAVYIMILPAMGMVSDILAVFSRKPIFGYRPMVYAMAGIAFLGFIVWAHHMFQSGMNPTLGTTFAISTMFIAVPSAIKTFNWLGTLWGGNIKFTAAMWNAIAFVSMFVIGGLSGIFMASTAVDVHIHDTYFIVAHIHYVLFGGTTFGIFGAIYFWYPKMFGRMMNETLGKIHFFLSIVAFNCTFFAMHILGIGGFPRRVPGIVHTQYSSFAHFLEMNRFISISAFCLGLAQIPFIINFLGSWIWGPKAPRNPWLATTLEWETESPPPHGNFATVPVVHHGPYEYSSPLVEEDWLAQTRYVEGQENFVVKH